VEYECALSYSCFSLEPSLDSPVFSYLPCTLISPLNSLEQWNLWFSSPNGPLGELNPFSIKEHIFDTPATPTIAAAASLAAPEVMSIELSGDPLGPCFDESIPIGGSHALAGLHVTYDDARGRLQFLSIEKGTPAARIPHWRTRLRHAYILGINNVDIATTADLTQEAISVLRSNGDITCNPRLTFDDVKNTLSVSGLLQLYFDQLRDIHCVNQQVRSDQPTAQRLTRKGLQTQPDWDEWVASEAEQLDAYATQRMFGETCPPPCDGTSKSL
jgi:hypothetical protein